MLKALLIFIFLFSSVSAFAGKSAQYRAILEAFTGSSEEADPALTKAFRKVVRSCRSMFSPKLVLPSKEWTAADADRNPESQQCVRAGRGMIAFIDNGLVFIKDTIDVRSPFHVTDIPMYIKGPSNAKAIVKYEGDLIVLTEDNKVYRIYIDAKKIKWVKIQDHASHISVSETPDGGEMLSMPSKLDPVTLKPL